MYSYEEEKRMKEVERGIASKVERNVEVEARRTKS